MRQIHSTFLSLLTICAMWLVCIVGCKSASRPKIPEASPSPPTNVTAPATANYFEGSKACKFLADVDGFDLGGYVPYTQTEGHACQTIEPSIKLSCNPQADLLCNSISYQVDGEKEGATSAELFYMGTSLSSTAHKKDMQTFVRYSNELTKKALGDEIDSEMKQYIFSTTKFLPMKPEGDSEVVERHTFKKKLGSGFVSILARRNDMPGGPAYMIRFTVYPDERWSN